MKNRDDRDDLYAIVDIYTDDELHALEDEKPTYPPMPAKYHAKLWGEFAPEERSAYRAEYDKRKLGMTYTLPVKETEKVRTIEWFLWDHQCDVIKREFYDYEATTARWAAKRWAAMTPEERAFEIEMKEWKKAEAAWLEGLDEKEWLAAIKGKLHFPGWERYAISAETEEAAKARKKAERDADLARKEAKLSLYRANRLAGKRFASFEEAAFKYGEDLLGRIPETVEEYEAIKAHSDILEKEDAAMRCLEGRGLDAALHTLKLAEGKVTEKLLHLRIGWTAKGLKKDRDRKHNAKRKDDPEFKAKRAAYMRERRAKLKAQVTGA